MYEVVSKTGVTVYGPSSIQNCKEVYRPGDFQGEQAGIPVNYGRGEQDGTQ